DNISTITLRTLIEHPLDIPLMQWALFVIIGFFIVMLVFIHWKKDPLDLRWLILDQQHRPVFTKIAQIIALAVSTWAFVILTIKGTLSETYFLAYMAVWSGSVALETYFNRGNRAPRRAGDAEDYTPAPDCAGPYKEGEPK